jgi:hypothetical protein
MREVLRTTDAVALSYAQALLRDANIEFATLDAHISAIEGAIGAFPRRVAVEPEDYTAARDLLTQAGLDEIR